MPSEKDPNVTSLGVSASEAASLFANLEQCPALLLAVSGGPDSIALMVLAVRWTNSLKRKPALIVATVDHGLRAEAKREAADVARLARKLGLKHRTLKWIGKKPAAGLQQAARLARYRLLADAARKAGASHILTAHTLDDQAETVLMRMSRGSGITGLTAMGSVVPVPGEGDVKLVRPLLGIPKARLIATLTAAKISFASDPSNSDPRFTRARLRGLMPQLAEEGLDARRLSQLAQRLKRADEAIEAMVNEASERLARDAPSGTMAFEQAGFVILPAEIVIRLLGRAITQVGDEGPVELGKLEALFMDLKAAQKAGTRKYRRSLAGAIVTLDALKITVERAPPRRVAKGRRRPLTKGQRGQAKAQANATKSR
ncbi:MAG TPA: tRNA lysidine(34) synthetase TilS [Pseudolabrys sp.]|jgi:tRNA(Ile)-lysidine synthase